MREDLIKKREEKKLSRAMMAQKCECSERLIFGIEEDDWITHPDIASRLAAGEALGRIAAEAYAGANRDGSIYVEEAETMIVIAVIIAMVLTHIVMLVLGAVFVGVAWMVLEVSELIYWRRVKKRNKQGGRKE